ncbi:hypothetical protein PCASD_08816 [Puccinia coronata f. sp. avenae]|uniref:Uncharacterized protein n=1 Tax=Puccinia coronata f. sp. avenae TaxID=200324 RepID=A0A2N5UPC6_9BASI|nr:hypothetical protein PCASD_08816 [Puccinia coronata f. sp. avenae]
MIDVAKHRRRPAHIQNAESAPTNQALSPTVISQEQSAIEERLLAEQQDAAHEAMVWSTVDGLYDRDEVPLEPQLVRSLVDELNDLDPITRGPDDADPAICAVDQDQWLGLLDDEHARLQEGNEV